MCSTGTSKDKNNPYISAEATGDSTCDITIFVKPRAPGTLQKNSFENLGKMLKQFVTNTSA